MRDPKDFCLEFEANAKNYYKNNDTEPKVEIRYISDQGCYTGNGILYCICSKCRTRAYELPNDFNNFTSMLTAQEADTLQAILENIPERFFSYVAELTTKYYQSGFDAGVNESIKSINKLTPNKIVLVKNNSID